MTHPNRTQTDTRPSAAALKDNSMKLFLKRAFKFLAAAFDFSGGTCSHRESGDRRPFCFEGIAFVKCTVCGSESTPWLVSKQISDAWTQTHLNALEEYVEIYRRVKEARV